MRIRIYAGQYFDEETGLHYNYFRYYDPSTGRYITSDPIGLQGGLNTYSYVYNNPTGFIDTSGLFSTNPYIHLLASIKVALGITSPVVHAKTGTTSYADAVIRITGGFGTYFTGSMFATSAAAGGSIAGGWVAPGVLASIGGWEIGQGINHIFAEELDRLNWWLVENLNSSYDCR